MLGKRSSGLEAQMGKQHSDSFREDISLKTLSPLRLLRGVICLCILFCTAFMMLVYCGFPSFFVLRFISIRLSRKALNFFFGSWLALWPVLFEKINRTKVVFSGDKVPAKERVLLIANHRTEVDWMYFWDLALRKGSIGSIKYVLKSSLMRLPVFGWGFHIFEFIPVERKWEVDESNLRRMLRSFRDPKEPLWLALFPEGTDYTEQKCLRSKKFAAENGFPVLNNVLLPKTKGFCACLEELRGSLDAVYDVTIGYKSRCPSFLDNVFGSQPSEVHVNIRRVTPEAIPAEDAKIASWLVDTFKLKDRLLSEFYSQGKFSNQETETDLSTVKCVWNCSTVIVFTALCIYLTFFTSIWYTIYVSLASGYLTSVTLFSLYPLPLVEVLKRCV